MWLDRDQYVEGEVVDAHFPSVFSEGDVFSEGWTILALITESGHPRYGQVAPFGASEVDLKGVRA